MGFLGFFLVVYLFTQAACRYILMMRIVVMCNVNMCCMMIYNVAKYSMIICAVT